MKYFYYLASAFSLMLILLILLTRFDRFISHLFELTRLETMAREEEWKDMRETLVTEAETNITYGKVSGFYAGSVKNWIFLWTANGLKVFEIGSETALSFYDVCSDHALILRNEYGKNSSLPGKLDFLLWKKWTKPGNYTHSRFIKEGSKLTVKNVDSQNSRLYVDYPYFDYRNICYGK